MTTAAPWACPVCTARLSLTVDGRQWRCPNDHDFDIARAGYVNLLGGARRRSLAPGDSQEMVEARRRFLGRGAYDPLAATLTSICSDEGADLLLDVGCGDGYYTRRLPATSVLGIDLSKPAVAGAARSHPDGWYAVASANRVPLDDGSVDLAVNVFGPIFATELGRVVRAGGLVVAAHPGPRHLTELRSLVYDSPRGHEIKAPLRGAPGLFGQVGAEELDFVIDIDDVETLWDLYLMTPYRWHGPRDIRQVIEEAATAGFRLTVDVLVTLYRRSF